jgi:hypothetical protein
MPTRRRPATGGGQPANRTRPLWLSTSVFCRRVLSPARLGAEGFTSSSQTAAFITYATRGADRAGGRPPVASKRPGRKVSAPSVLTNPETKITLLR